jgi:hypothetical protein
VDAFSFHSYFVLVGDYREILVGDYCENFLLSLWAKKDNGGPRPRVRDNQSVVFKFGPQPLAPTRKFANIRRPPPIHHRNDRKSLKKPRCYAVFVGVEAIQNFKMPPKQRTTVVPGHTYDLRRNHIPRGVQGDAMPDDYVPASTHDSTH